MSDHSSGQFYKGLFLGTVMGAVAGILLAPEEGKKSRIKLKRKLEAAKKEYGPILDELSKKMEKLNHDFAPKAEEIKEEIKETKEEIKEKVEKKVKQSALGRRRPPKFFKGV